MPGVWRVDHPWNDPDEDGHDCVDCEPTSIWKCDEAAHPPRLRTPLDLLTQDEQKALHADLQRMAHQRRTAPFPPGRLGSHFAETESGA